MDRHPSPDAYLRRHIHHLKGLRDSLVAPARELLSRHTEARVVLRTHGLEDEYIAALERAGLLDDIGSLRDVVRRNTDQ